VKVANRLPAPVMANPERLSINYMMIILGLMCLDPTPVFPTVAAWSNWYQYEWAAASILGGCAALHGAYRDARPSERLGCTVVAICSFTFGVSMLHTSGIQAGMVAAFVFTITLAKILRLIRSLAYDATLRASRENQET
jgi:CHASE2 domain-containing sensor protein